MALTKAEVLEKIKQMRLLDDEFFTKCFEENIECAELVLRIILERPDIYVKEVHTQHFVSNLANRSVRLDVFAVDSLGRHFNIEIQRDDRGAGSRRARYNSSMMDVNALGKSDDFNDLPETYVIFITENDVIGRSKPLYHIERVFMDNGERFEDGAHIIYVNGAYRAEDPVGKLMHDFACTEASEMFYDTLADRVAFYKKSKEGNVTMSKLMEDLILRERAEATREALSSANINCAQKMLLSGRVALQDVAEFSGLTLDEVKLLQNKLNA